jgi:hypothetical protein
MDDPSSFVQHGGGWVTNVGNAFFDLGSMWAVQQAVEGEPSIHLSSSFSRWTTSKLGRSPSDFLFGRSPDVSNVFDTGSMFDADYVIRAGAHLSKRWFDMHGEVLREASANGAKLIFHGVGFSEWAYESDEVAEVKRLLGELDPYVIISRDERTYENLKDIPTYSYNGIDCGFFISDLHDPMPMREEYVALNFDKTREPDRLASEFSDQMVVRPHHSFWYPWGLRNYPTMLSQYYRKQNVFVSDVPHEYLDVYAGAIQTHTDRVHAAVATLVFGGKAKLYFDTDRSLLLDRAGAYETENGYLELPLSELKSEKDDQIAFLSDVLNE